MPLHIERIPTLSDNYTYLLVCQETGEAAVVDAPEAGPVIARAEALGAQVRAVLCTHHHADHSQAAPQLAAHFGGIPVLGHHSDARRIPGFTTGLEEGDTVRIGHCEARVLHIPAHTTGHVAYVFEDPHAVFCGDTMFAGGCGRLFEGDPEAMFAAMRKLDALPGETLVCCGHEYTESNLRFARAVEPDNPAIAAALDETCQRRAGRAADWHDAGPDEMTVPTTLERERATNPFLRASNATELGERRAWKDRF